MYNIKTLKHKGALFIEYALVLAFVVVVGVFFVGENGIGKDIKTITTKASDLLAGKTPGFPNQASIDYFEQLVAQNNTYRYPIPPKNEGDEVKYEDLTFQKLIASASDKKINDIMNQGGMSPIILDNDYTNNLKIISIPTEQIGSLDDLEIGKSYTVRQYKFLANAGNTDSGKYTGEYRDVQVTIGTSGAGSTLRYLTKGEAQPLEGGTLDWIKE